MEYLEPLPKNLVNSIGNCQQLTMIPLFIFILYINVQFLICTARKQVLHSSYCKFSIVKTFQCWMKSYSAHSTLNSNNGCLISSVSRYCNSPTDVK